ncbi:winged helix-turn-helix domain-containing protein [Actinomadura sp. ATCC 31491]|uniref:Winged helix-turn-helix domain-containing protein n=1 Tax=Actinomadura luzonensis TaxID=2805427 RepID=A0ABT0G4Z1_9ACTN|nr:winged helix-turn-helix domain-containing protein [Actinomadura luzonensis]MCK2219669.1 winged helix-turn-helix domain-containing protein [Actinomadura luzonensis]
MINWRDDLPRWEQIVRVIRRRITTGEYQPGRMITERQIIEEFGVAKITARKAVAGLRDRGLIYTRPNLGSFVGPEPPDDED